MLDQATYDTLWMRTAAIHAIEIVAYAAFQPATRLDSAIVREKHEKRTIVLQRTKAWARDKCKNSN